MNAYVLIHSLISHLISSYSLTFSHGLYLEFPIPFPSIHSSIHRLPVYHFLNTSLYSRNKRIRLATSILSKETIRVFMGVCICMFSAHHSCKVCYCNYLSVNLSQSGKFPGPWITLKQPTNRQHLCRDKSAIVADVWSEHYLKILTCCGMNCVKKIL